jgi:hypothetical protein
MKFRTKIKIKELKGPKWKKIPHEKISEKMLPK